MDKPSPELKFAILASDVALFTLHQGELWVRLIQVNRPPYFPSTRGLPGGLLHTNENAEETAIRMVREKALVDTKKIHIEQLATFSGIQRDPRGRVVAVAYLALVPWEALSEDEKKNTDAAWWSPIKNAKKLAYDHDEMLADAIKRLRSRIEYTTIIQKILPKHFTLTDLEKTYAEILGQNLDKRNFRKKILKLGILAPVKGKKTEGPFRPAQLYTFTSAKVDEFKIL